MSRRELPVLDFKAFRRYPTKLEDQQFSNEREVCHHCLSGACCVNQDAIALSAFDLLRLAAFFDIPLAKFMLIFTQDRFGDGDDEQFRQGWNNDPNSSVMTWLRRRTSSPWSPCIFLKYVREPDGTPRRTCSVHDGRPLSCREYYYTHCKSRGTGELASLLAEGFEKMRDGEITEETVDQELVRFGAHDFKESTLAQNMEYGFWVEMKCAINMDQANVEGSNSYDIADYQDPIDEKLNRVLSAKYLRSEEGYGLKPRDEQLMPYTSGLSFSWSAEHARIMKIAQTPPSSNLFARGNYPHYVGMRTLVPKVKHADLFPVIPEGEINGFLHSLPQVALFPDHPLADVRSTTLHDLYAAVLKAYDYLLRFASHVATLEPILESDPPGTIETELYRMFAEFETSLNPYLARNPYIEIAKRHMAKAAVDLLEQQTNEATDPENVFWCFKSLCTLNSSSTLPRELRARIRAISKTIHERLQKGEPHLYRSSDNPVEARRFSGKRLDPREAGKAWSLLYGQVVDIRYAALAAVERVDLPSFYRRVVADLERLPFRKSYASCLFDTIRYLSQSMSFNHRIAYQEMAYQDVADRLASYSLRLFNWQTESQGENPELEVIADFVTSVHKGLGLGYDHDETFGLVICRILCSQLGDGSWNTNLRGTEAPDDQAEYLQTLFRTTWACINALRPMRSDVLTPANARLGLV